MTIHDELFDVCDAEDNVIGQETRSKVHAQNLLHRAVHIWIWNSDDELLVQLRTPVKDQYPNCYTSSASGHVDAGEDYLTAANRELAEELQLSGQLVFETKLPAAPETAFEHTVLYFLRTDDTPVPDPGEIAELSFRPVSAIKQHLDQAPDLFTPPFQMLMDWWWSQRRGD